MSTYPATPPQAYEKRTKGTLGCLQAWLFGSKMDLLFGEGDSRVTLLPGDHVRFRLFTDLVTKRKRAGRIEPLLETFQFSTETREMVRNRSLAVYRENWWEYYSGQNVSKSEVCWKGGGLTVLGFFVLSPMHGISGL